VAATLIWAERTNFRNSGNSLSPDADGEEINRTFREDMGSTLGLTIQPPPVGVMNAMEMEFTIYPSGLRSLVDKDRIVFDITRQRGGAYWAKIRYKSDNTTRWLEVEQYALPNNDEEPNDDSHQYDEDNIPTNDHIYSIDAVGPRTDTAPEDSERVIEEVVSRFNFYEFVRVKFNSDFKNMNGLIEGSRCSPKIKWRSRIRVERDSSGKFKRKNVDSHDNEIVEGWLEIGSPPF
jgi:hypothetical protein